MTDVYRLVNDVKAAPGVLEVEMPDGSIHALRCDPNWYTLDAELEMTTLDLKEAEIQNAVNDALEAEDAARVVLNTRNERVRKAIANRKPAPPPTDEEKDAVDVLRRKESDRLYQDLLRCAYEQMDLAVSPQNPGWRESFRDTPLHHRQAKSIVHFFVTQGSVARNRAVYRTVPRDGGAPPTPTDPNPTSGRRPRKPRR